MVCDISSREWVWHQVCQVKDGSLGILCYCQIYNRYFDSVQGNVCLCMDPSTCALWFQHNQPIRGISRLTEMGYWSYMQAWLPCDMETQCMLLDIQSFFWENLVYRVHEYNHATMIENLLGNVSLKALALIGKENETHEPWWIGWVNS